MRTSVRRLALPAAALAAALALTACQSTDQEPTAKSPEKPQHSTTAPAATPTTAEPTPPPTDGTPAGGTPTGAPSQTPTPTPEPTRTTTPGKPAPSTPTTTAKPRPPADGDDAPASRPCTAADVKVVASKVTRPINHLALTITNTGGVRCDAMGAPLVGFDGSQAPIRIVEESKPQAVVTLLPGESAYASLILTGEPGGDTHGMTVRTIKVNLTADSMETVTAPKGTYVDDGAAVSYWQRELEDALQY
ncbi:DUF4232 domain-containing protein [Streptomyces sp. NPDC127049]|uniref:DUF4232 domain-containing protein n=1 Tax=Streptomyces sp. NPDC127049 TaxID=3347118 RepID=UPI00365D5203